MSSISVVSYFKGGEFNKSILEVPNTTDITIFTPAIYADQICEAVDGYSGKLTIVTMNIEDVFTNLVKELTKMCDDPIEVLENILNSYYVSVAIDNGICDSPLIAFIGNDFKGDFSKIILEDLEEDKIYLDVLKKYDDAFMDVIIQEKTSGEYINSELIIAHQDMWYILTQLVSVIEKDIRGLNMIGDLSAFLLIGYVNLPDNFRKIRRIDDQ